MRETILQALFLLLTRGGRFETVGRRLILWTQVAAQPALFLRHVGDSYSPHATRLPPRIVMHCEIWLYSNAGQDPDAAPEIALNILLDAVETLLRPLPGREAQTLGGLVTHCWIEGQVEIHPGDLDGQAIAIVPVKILVPTLNGG